jgi:hypothetical protein
MSAQRPINIRSNGKGVAIGGMSTKDGFECSFDADFNKNVNIDGTLTTVGKINGVDIGTDTYVVGGSRDNITDENWISSAPSFMGTYSQNNQWYSTISCRHRNGQDDGSNYGMQLRSVLTQADNLSWRQNMNGSWGGWKTILDSNNTADYVVEQGVSSGWNYTKWNSGKSEAWRSVELGDVSLTSSLAGGVYSSSSYNARGLTFPTGLFVAIPLAFANVYSNGYTICQVASANTTQMVYRIWSPYSATVSGVIVSLYVVGRWK